MCKKYVSIACMKKNCYDKENGEGSMTMIDCISVENMRLSDAYTIANLVPSLELMYRAARGVYQAVSWKGSIAIVAGSGNNGGDGYALAWILREQGYDCAVFTVSNRLSNDGAYYAEKAVSVGVPVREFTSGCLKEFDIVVDCLLGTGFSGSVRENYRIAIEEINATDAYIVSVDINSGMNGDTGEAEIAVVSDLTVTIGYVKTGLVTENAGKYMKRLVCVDIGIVLVKEEQKICGEGETLIPGCLACPSWLDLNVLKIC